MSMKAVWKFPLSIAGLTISQVKVGAPIHVGVDPNGDRCLWVEVHPDVPWPHDTEVIVVGTGSRMPDTWRHAGSYVDGQYVWHVYLQEVS